MDEGGVRNASSCSVWSNRSFGRRPVFWPSRRFVARPGRRRARDGSEDEKLLKAAKIGVAGPGLLDYFRQHTTTQAQQEHIQTLIRQLGDDSFKVRQAATTELAALGPTAVPYLRRALNDPDEELKERAENLIRTADGLEARAAQSAAAARLIVSGRRPTPRGPAGLHAGRRERGGRGGSRR